MMTLTSLHTKTVKNELVSAIRNVCSAMRIVLFGSFARGDQDATSAIDILVVVPDGYLAEHSRFATEVAIMHALSQLRIPKDVLLYTESEFQTYLGSTNHVVRRATDEGVTLYAA